MSARRTITQLAGQLQVAGAFNADALATFVTDNNLTLSELSLVQNELITNLVLIFNTQRLASTVRENLHQGHDLQPPAKMRISPPEKTIPSLAELPNTLRAKILKSRSIYLVNNLRPLRADVRYEMATANHVPCLLNAKDTPVFYDLDQLYAFPYFQQVNKVTEIGDRIHYYVGGDDPDGQVQGGIVIDVGPITGQLIVGTDMESHPTTIERWQVTRVIAIIG